MSCLCCNKERDGPQHTYQSACCCRCCCYSCCSCVNGPLLQCTQTGLRVFPSGRRRDREERAGVVVRGGEAKEEKKEKERGITRRMEVRCLLMLWICAASNVSWQPPTGAANHSIAVTGGSTHCR